MTRSASLCRILQHSVLITAALAGAVVVASGKTKPAAPNTRSASASFAIRVKPSQTDPAIKSFDSPHFIYLNRDSAAAHEAGNNSADRHELLLWIPGTQPPGTNSQGPGAAGRFCEIASELGYHAIVLKYPNDESASVCREDRNAAAFEDFRMALIVGGKTPHITISRTDSIENRLIKLLLYLKENRPTEQWAQFLTDAGGIRWEAIAVAGQSQGGGHAALIGIKHRVARVICTGAPKDYSLAFGKPAAWLTEASATPKACFFALNHRQDHQGCSPAQQLENLRALKLDSLGAPADIDVESAPYHHSRILLTNYPGKKLESKEAHTSAISPRNEAHFGKTWIYMLTEKTP